MKKVEFRLSMIGRASPIGVGPGSGRNLVLVRSMSDRRCAALLENQTVRRWPHLFSDGWVASVSARILLYSEKPSHSDGFAGYDWMVDDIMTLGVIGEGPKRRLRRSQTGPIPLE